METYCFSVARVGFEPTASLVLNQSGLPVAYRAILLRNQKALIPM